MRFQEDFEVLLMDAGKVLLNQIFSKRLLEIPFYQRAYVWKEEQWERLLSDMEFITDTQRPYFMGSVILKQGEAPKVWENFSDRKIVVDGQQRLTTLLILLRVLALKTKKVKSFDSDFRLGNDSDDDDDDTPGRIALAHGKNDADAFNLVMNHKVAEKIDNEKNSQIIAAFNYFVSNLNPEKIAKNTIMSCIQFVCIDLAADENEQQVFDTINSLGVNLTTAELLKNYFFNKDNIKDYITYWQDIFELNDDTREYWETEIEVGKKKRMLLDLFFDSYFQIILNDDKFEVKAEDKKYYSRDDRIAQSYQDFIKKYCNGDKQKVISGISDYAKTFRDWFNPAFCQQSMSYSSHKHRINVIIFGLKNSTLIPYILYAAQNITDTHELNAIIDVLESYIMRRLVMHVSNKNYNRLFTSLILNNTLTASSLKNHLSGSQDATTFMPSDADLREGFHKSKLSNLHAKGIIYFIESYQRSAKSSTGILCFNLYSLEHLMPKKWRNEWSYPSTEEERRIRDSVLLTLGNLAIITQPLNSAIRDSKWDDKKNGKNSAKGLAAYASGLFTMDDVLKESDWDESKINARADSLCNIAEKIWKI